ncbi:MAG: ATP-binding protein [Candidatus Ozemobacteraceae bacterium]
MINEQILLQIVAEWLRETTLPEITIRDIPVISPEKLSSILAVVGPRRAGKTFLLFQLIQELEQSGKATRDKILFVDFEDFRLQGFLPADVDRLFTCFTRLTGHLPRFLFFDEIQHVPDWSRMLRTLHNRRIFKMVVTGSNSTLLVQEVATELRGRYEDVLLLPFSFPEFLRYRRIDMEKTSFHTPARGIILGAFDEFLTSGGFPETFERTTVAEKKKILQNYFSTIFYRDILDRHNLKSPHLLNQMMRTLLENYSEVFSLSSFEKQVKAAGQPCSKRTLANFLGYLEEAFFLITTRKHSFSARSRLMNPRKTYLIDTGFALLGEPNMENRGKRLENLVATHFSRHQQEMYYFSGRNECDFLIKEGTRLTEAWQVCWELHPKNEKRELKGLLEAMTTLDISRGGVLTFNQEETRSFEAREIGVLPVWKWLLKASLQHR